MKVAITGGSGFVGQELTSLLQSSGHEVYILTRSPEKITDSSVQAIKWLTDGATPENELDGMDAWVNLAGASINDGRWTEEQKGKIYKSRMDATDEVLRILRAVDMKPAVLVNASAIGYYPHSFQKVYTEQSNEMATDFLAKTVHDWEQKAESAKALGIRVAYGRFGIILGENEGALPLMALPYKLFAGGKVGSGKQWVSWVHVEDVARALLFAIENETMTGPFNVAAPYALTMNEFGKVLGSVLHRPHWMPVPSFALKLALGEKSRLVLEGQHVKPEKLLLNGFAFTFPTAKEALEDIYN